MRYKIYATNDLSILQINNIGYAASPKETRFGPGKRDKFLICYVLSGRGFYNGTPLVKGQGFLITPDIIEHIYPDENQPWELLWFTSVDRKMWDLLKYYNADSKTLVFSYNFIDDLEKLKNTVISHSMKTVNAAEILSLYFGILKNHLGAESISANKTASQRYIDFSVNYIKSNYDQNITVTKLTELLGVSQPYLYKIFKETLSKSPKEFITDYRITRAKHLLKETDLSIIEVAHSVGFEDAFCFSKCFSKKEGISPTKYRSNNKI